MQTEMPASHGLNNALPITPQIYRILRERIVRNDVQPGNRISETEIARSYGVSRQPVREAFIKLAEQGLLAVLPQRGTIISKINYSQVLDARFIREAIEADIVKILARTPDPSLVKTLRALLADQKRAALRSAEEFTRLDETFHLTLADGAGKRGAWTLIEGPKSQMDRVRFLSLAQFPMTKLIGQHEAIVARIETGDVAGAETAIRLHLREVLSDFPSILRANPEFFDLPAGDLPQPANVPTQGGENE